jgi:oligoribonuclease
VKLYWLDLETTGLDPANTQVLEVSVATADLRDPFNITRIYDAVLELQTPVEKLDPFIINMHTKNGLLSECMCIAAKSRARVDEELSSLVEWVEDKDERATLAGSSIHFDHSYIKVHLPLTNKKLSHRHYDVSALKLFCQSMGMPRFKKAEAHRAWDDIVESVTHARECTEWLKQNLK